MNRNRRLSSSWIGGQSACAYTSHGNRWNCVNDSHQRDQNDRYSSNAEYDGSLSRDVGYQDNYTRYHTDRQPPIQSPYDRSQNDVRKYETDRHPRYQDFSDKNTGNFSNDDYRQCPSGSGYSRNAHHQEPYYYDIRRASYSPQYDRKHDGVRNYANDFNHPYDSCLPKDGNSCTSSKNSNYRKNYIQNSNYDNMMNSDGLDFSHTNTRYFPNIDCHPRNDNYPSDYNQNSNNYDDMRVLYSPQSNTRHDKVRRYSDSTDPNYGDGRDNQTRRITPEPSYDGGFDNRMSVQTSPPRWSIDGQPVTFTEYQKFLLNSQRLFEGKNPRNYLPDYDKEQEFVKLMNKMKIGERDREKLAEEIRFNDVPPPPPPQRGGFRRNRH